MEKRIGIENNVLDAFNGYEIAFRLLPMVNLIMAYLFVIYGKWPIFMIQSFVISVYLYM